MDFKNIKPILQTKKRIVKDPIRYPNVISSFEEQSKRDFTAYLQMETKMLITEINR